MALHAEDSDDMPVPGPYLHPAGSCLDDLSTITLADALDGDPGRCDQRTNKEPDGR